MSVPVICRHDKLSGVVAEYHGLRRLRHRRLLAYLRLQGLERTFRSLVQEMDAFLPMAHLRQLIQQGQWCDAVGYLSRFLPYDSGSGLQSAEAQVLHRFLATHRYLAGVLAGMKEGDAVVDHFTNHRGQHELVDRTLSHGALRLRCIWLTAILRKQQLRKKKQFALDWERVRHKACEIVDDLVHRTLELKGVVLPPAGAGPMKPGTVST
ncbi:hypothetical protein QOZ80_9AG0684130 [Eleusine coracana subsp. coracana]|nr:hypothetical protein QOZ80_9AG0684130 [Eleusine coracana subsp. coracana]